jgi:hypothetical protein
VSPALIAARAIATENLFGGLLVRRAVMGRNLQRAARSFLIRLGLTFAITLLFTLLARAGGPEYVAGSTYFVSSATGQPIVWAQGQINYYTDQGDLSPILPNATANAFVASTFSQWTSVSTATLTVTAAGQLAEDVNGLNIEVSGGVVTAPADIAPSATDKPVGIVYDYDGTVTDALLGVGAGNPSQCFWNAAYGGPDNIGSTGNFLHALVVLNGQCAQQSSQLTDLEYRLLRVLGEVLGLGWSQLNLNVITGQPAPTTADFAGFPLMHYMDPVTCVPITTCYASPLQIAADDAAALSRLYPAVGNNTARIHGTVYFVDSSGNIAQPMQGVNVVARWIDPSTNAPSDQYSASSVSGFRFTGNAGNPITGFTNALGIPFSQYGSNEPTLEGFFDLGGLVIPNGGTTGQYELTVEALDSVWSAGVNPYDPNQVAPSGASQPIVVSVSAGGDFDQDLVMAGSAQAIPQWASSETWSIPAAIPPAGDWEGSLSGYGDVPYFSLTAQANRTLSIAVTALDETGAATESKAEPVIGMWTQGDPPGTPPPAFTTSPFDSGAAFGMTRLDAEILNSNTFLIGLADLRGDGRPDYHYHAHVLYADSLSPVRVSANGGPIAIQGVGFDSNLTASIGSTGAPLLAADAGQMLLAVPPMGDGLQNVTISDPTSGSFSTMTNVLTVGAAASDQLLLVQGSNSSTAAGTQAVNPMIVQVVASDGVTPVNGATIGWSTTVGTQLSACGGASTCTSFTDEGGLAATFLTPASPGTVTTVATLAPGVYTPAQSQVATLVSTSSTSSQIGVTPQNMLVAQGASVSLPLTARVVNNGAPQSGVQVNFLIDQGAAFLSAPNATTNSNGFATVTLALTNFTTNVMINACVGQANNPCQSITANAVPLSTLNLQPVAGAGQIVAGQAFQPVVVRATDSSTPPNPVLGASVLFQSTLLRPGSGSSSGTNPSMPVILGSSQLVVASDINGLASMSPSMGLFAPPIQIALSVSLASDAPLQYTLEALPAATSGTAPPGGGSPAEPVLFPPRSVSDPPPPGRAKVLLNLPPERP